MTTSQSPDYRIRQQSAAIAARLKQAAAGEIYIPSKDKDRIKIGIAMDDKTITLEIPWETIRNTTQSALDEYIFVLMKGEMKQ